MAPRYLSNTNEFTGLSQVVLRKFCLYLKDQLHNHLVIKDTLIWLSPLITRIFHYKIGKLFKAELLTCN